MTAAMSARPRPGRRPPVPPMKSSVPPGRTLPRRGAPRASGRISVLVESRGAPRRSRSPPAARSRAAPAVTSTWSIGPGRSSKKRSSSAGSWASKAAVLRAPSSLRGARRAARGCARRGSRRRPRRGRGGPSRARCRRSRRSRRRSGRAAPAPARRLAVGRSCSDAARRGGDLGAQRLERGGVDLREASGTAGSCRSGRRAGPGRGSPASPAAATRRPRARARRRRSAARRR